MTHYKMTMVHPGTVSQNIGLKMEGDILSKPHSQLERLRIFPKYFILTQALKIWPHHYWSLRKLF